MLRLLLSLCLLESLRLKIVDTSVQTSTVYLFLILAFLKIFLIERSIYSARCVSTGVALPHAETAS